MKTEIKKIAETIGTITINNGICHFEDGSQCNIKDASNSYTKLFNACHTLLSNFKANQNFGTLPTEQELQAGINILTAAIEKQF